MLAASAAVGDNDVVAVQEGDPNLQVFRAPDCTRSTLITFSNSFRYPHADDVKLADGDTDIVGIRNRNSAPRWIYHNTMGLRPCGADGGSVSRTRQSIQTFAHGRGAPRLRQSGAA